MTKQYNNNTTSFNGICICEWTRTKGEKIKSQKLMIMMKKQQSKKNMNKTFTSSNAVGMIKELSQIKQLKFD